MASKSQILQWIASISLLGVNGCGIGNLPFSGGDRTSQPAVNLTSDDWTDVTIKVLEREQYETPLQYSLATPPTAYRAEISGCQSGYEKALGVTETAVRVQKSDSSCIFRLLDITLDTEVFTFSNIVDWSPGVNFSALGDQGTPMRVDVFSNLTSPIADSQAVMILFAVAQKGLPQQTGPSIAAGVSVSGTSVLSMAIGKLDLAVNPATGGGLFSFTVTCMVPATGNGFDEKCENDVLVDLQFALRIDTYGPVLDIDQCRAIATQDGNGVSVGIPFAANTNSSFPNGGFTTGQIKGPVRLYAPANRSLIFAIAGRQTTSGCKYFRITVNTPSP